MKKSCLLTLLMACCCLTQAQPLAFPTAEGYGKHTIGGRGGKVYEVTNLNDDGAGSLRAAVEAEGARTIVFRVSGTIDLQKPLRIKHPFITIAGQTAPGDGICLKRYPVNIDADEVIIRYIRVRLGDESGGESDAISGRFHKNIILDHVSASWSVDETMSIYWCENVTLQWCMITESLYNSNHFKGHHGFGGIWGSNKSTYHHNLIAHHSSRNPRFSSGCGDNDYRNNVVFNWGYNSCYGGGKVERKMPDRFNQCQFNMVANYYKPGPATTKGVRSRIANPSYYEGGIHGDWYIADNYVFGSPEVTADNWNGGVAVDRKYKNALDTIRLAKPWGAMPIHQQTAEDCFESVLAFAGCSKPNRDTVDKRIVEEVRMGKATYEGVAYKRNTKVMDSSIPSGIIDTQNDVGGWPELKSLPAPKDTDHDGMPDEWEKNHGLDPNNPADGNLVRGKDGYTNLEVYMNSLAVAMPRNGEEWLDTDGNHINAHGGNIIRFNGRYYWYGESRPDFGGATEAGIAAYSSTDLLTWKNEGIILGVSNEPGNDIERGCIMERPKVVYNEKTKKFVMLFHLELKGKGYAAARVAFAQADSPTGPFVFLRSQRIHAGKWPFNFKAKDKAKAKSYNASEWKQSWTPEWVEAVKDGMFLWRDMEGGQMSRDMTVFIDDDGKAYHITSSQENMTLLISELTDDYLDYTGKYAQIAPSGQNEAPVIFKREGRYWLICSGCTGWAPNEARMFTAKNIWGPWAQQPTPFTEDNGKGYHNFGTAKTFGAQGTYVIEPEPGKFVFMADIWNPRHLRRSLHLWLPINFTPDDTPTIPWADTWR